MNILLIAQNLPVSLRRLRRPSYNDASIDISHLPTWSLDASLLFARIVSLDRERMDDEGDLRARGQGCRKPKGRVRIGSV